MTNSIRKKEVKEDISKASNYYKKKPKKDHDVVLIMVNFFMELN